MHGNGRDAPIPDPPAAETELHPPAGRRRPSYQRVLPRGRDGRVSAAAYFRSGEILTQLPPSQLPDATTVGPALFQCEPPPPPPPLRPHGARPMGSGLPTTPQTQACGFHQ